MKYATTLLVVVLALCATSGSPQVIAQKKPIDQEIPNMPQPLPVAPPVDIDLPSVFKVKPGRISKLIAKTSLKELRWMSLSEDVDIIPSDNGKWVVISVSPSTEMLRSLRGSPLNYRIAAYGAKIVGTEAVPVDPVYVNLLVDIPPQPVPPTPPIPPVPPVPPTPPTPPPSPAPIPAAGNRVLIIYESADLSKYPATQYGIIMSQEVRAYLNSKCVAGADGKTKEWRMWDKDTDTTYESQIWKDAIKTKTTTLPWIIISTGTTGFSGPLPADRAATLALLRQYFGG